MKDSILSSCDDPIMYQIVFISPKSLQRNPFDALVTIVKDWDWTSSDLQKSANTLGLPLKSLRG